MSEEVKYELGDLVLVQTTEDILPVLIVRIQELTSGKITYNGRCLVNLKSNVKYSETLFDWITSLSLQHLKTKILSHKIPETHIVYNYLEFNKEVIIGHITYSRMYKPLLLSTLKYT